MGLVPRKSDIRCCWVLLQKGPDCDQHPSGQRRKKPILKEVLCRLAFYPPMPPSITLQGHFYYGFHSEIVTVTLPPRFADRGQRRVYNQPGWGLLWGLLGLLVGDLKRRSLWESKEIVSIDCFQGSRWLVYLPAFSHFQVMGSRRPPAWL